MVFFLPALGLFGAGAASLPFVGQSIGREGERARQERERTGTSRTLRGDLGILGRAIRDPGAEGRSAFGSYFLGPQSLPTTQRMPSSGRVPGRVGDGRKPPAGGEIDWVSVLGGLQGAGGGGGGGGPRVPRELFRLQQTAEEQAMLERELADIEARRSAGDTALREGWGKVQSQNQAAAEKARSMVAEKGDTAAGYWTQAAQQATDLAEQRAAASGEFAGRAEIDIDPQGGAADFIQFMQSQAPAERQFAARQQEILGEDLDWMAGMASAQGEAYAGDLRREANVMSFERAREHNLRVQDRINQERMMLAQMQMQASGGGGGQQVDPLARLAEMVGTAAVLNNPSALAAQLGIDVPTATQMIRDYLAGTTQSVMATRPPTP
jgi:hypothetical protein